MARAYVHSTLCVLLLVVAAVATPVSDTTMMGTLEVQASPASATGEAVVELLRSLRPSIVAIQFRGSAGEALQLASQWLDVGFGDGYTAFIPVDLVEDGAQYVTGIVYRSELQVIKSGSWPAAVKPTHNTWVEFQATSPEFTSLFVLSVAFSRSPTTARKQARTTCEQLARYLHATSVANANALVAVSGALNTRTTFSETTDVFNEAGLGNEIMPPVDASHHNANTNAARNARNHFILASDYLGDLEVEVHVGAGFKFGAVVDPLRYTSTSIEAPTPKFVVRQFAVALGSVLDASHPEL